MASSIYASLQGESREFRLLTLEPSADRLAPVRCELSLASFDDGDFKYAALSYVWGDPLETAPIFVNGIEAQVTLNLEAALRHIRKASCVVVLWVDALCINQKDEAEKNHQVEMMREIYSGAELVIAWLGSAGEDSDLAMELLGQGVKALLTGQVMQSDSMREDDMGCQDNSIVNHRQGRDTHARDCEKDLATPLAQSSTSIPTATISGPQLSSPETTTDIGVAGSFSDFDHEHQDEAVDHYGNAYRSQCSGSNNREISRRDYTAEEFYSLLHRFTTREGWAILRLLTRSWWSRIWVVQEVLLAKMLIFRCGEAEISGETISKWAGGVIFIMAYTVSDEDILSDAIVSAGEILSGLDDPTLETYTAMDYLSVFGKREATRPHDHIYGLFGVIPPDDRTLLGTPDYSCKVEDLFISVVTKLMAEHKSLELLLQTGVPRAVAIATSTNMDLPSWVPNWTRTWLINHSTETWHGSLAPSSKPSFHFSEDSKELVLEGFMFDVIESVKPVPTYGQGKMPIWQADLTTKEGTAEGEQPPIHMIIVALCLSYSELERLDNEDGFRWVASFLRELGGYSISQRDARDAHNNCDYLEGFLEWIEETRDERPEEEIFQKIFNVEAAKSFVKWHHRAPNEELQNHCLFYSVFRQGLLGNAGHSMFRTYKGSFGTMQAAAAAGDILCVVPSCLRMLVLRKTQYSKYLVVGPSSEIAGTLHGEVAQAIERGEISQESFTLV